MASAIHFDTETIICDYRRVWRTASDGSPFFTWEEIVGLRIPDHTLDMVFFLYPSVAAAESGEEIGATGFVVGVLSELGNRKGHLYAVTNEHVIRHGREVIRFNTVDGKTKTFDLKGAWVAHPDGDDIAIAPLGVSGHQLKTKVMHLEMLLRHDEFIRQDIGLGDDVYMVGRFLGNEHPDANKPVIQHGKISSLMTTLENPETGHDQLSILVELRSMGGYSGALVILDPPGRAIGINYCHLPIRSPVKFEENGEEKQTEYFVDSPSGMAAIVPSWKIADMLKMDQFKRQRENDDQLAAAKSPATKTKPVLDDGGHPKRKTRDVPIPPISRKKFFDKLTKATQKRES